MSDVLSAEEVASVLHDHRAMPAVRDLARSHEQLRAERDRAIFVGQTNDDSYMQMRAHYDERLAAAARAGGCAADLAESWELSALRALGRRLPEDEMVAERGKAAVFRTCSRELRDALAAFDHVVSGQTAEKEEA